MAGDLEAITGLLAKHHAILQDPLNIQTPGDLVRADRRVVHAAMRSLRPRPTLEDISTWQDEARDLTTAAADPDWEQMAAFVVSFEARETDAGAERRVVAEQAEHDAPLPRVVRPGWTCAALSGWLHDKANVAAPAVRPPDDTDADGLEDAVEPDPDGAQAPRAGDPAAGPVLDAPRLSRPSFFVDEVALVSPAGAVVAVAGTSGELDVAPGTRLRVSVTGAVPADGVSAALRLRRPGRPGLVPHEVATARAGEPTEIELSRLPVGSFAAALAVWAPGGAVAAQVVDLPRLRRTDGAAP